MPYPGSLDLLTLTVTPYDNTTAVTGAVTPPTGAPITLTPVSTDGKHTWTATVAYTLTGKHVATWTVTGMGAGVQAEEIWVSALPAAGAGVVWRPERWHVADWVPARTLVAAVDGANNMLATFDPTTRPSGEQVDRLTVAAVAWVSSAVGDVDSTLYDMARATAAVWAAASIERGYPERDTAMRGTAIDTAAALFAQAAGMRDDLVRANAAVTGTTPDDPGSHLLPLYSFPAPPSWGDLDL